MSEDHKRSEETINPTARKWSDLENWVMGILAVLIAAVLVNLVIEEPDPCDAIESSKELILALQQERLLKKQDQALLDRRRYNQIAHENMVRDIEERLEQAESTGDDVLLMRLRTQLISLNLAHDEFKDSDFRRLGELMIEIRALDAKIEKSIKCLY